MKLVLFRKLNGPLGMFEIESFIRIRSPVSQALQEELGANMLKQDSHELRKGDKRNTTKPIRMCAACKEQ